MTPKRVLLATFAALTAAGCVPAPLEYLRVPMVSVTLGCNDGYMVYNRVATRSILVAPYLISEAHHRACGKNAAPLPVRARMVAEKQLGPQCRILRQSEPVSLNYEFLYDCDGPPASGPVVR